MKYAHLAERIPKEQRKALNDKILYLIDSGTAAEYGITAEDIYNAYTGDGGLHGLEQKDFDNYHKYSEAKKEVENGQFFTPAKICEYIMKSLKLSAGDTVADLTCGMGGFFNFAPTEDNVYGCELDIKAFKVARFLYPDAHIECQDIRNYNPGTRFDYVVGNPPFNLKWKIEGKEDLESQFYYCLKASELLKPLGIMAIVVPMSFLMDEFLDKKKIKLMESHFSFLGQVELPESAFASLGVTRFGTKVQFWQKHGDVPGWKPNRYQLGCDISLSSNFDMDTAVKHTYSKLLALPKANLEKNSAHVLLELARKHSSSKDFQYEVQKRLYQIKVHPATRDKYSRCCEYVYTFYTQQKPDDCTQEEWDKKKLTERKVLTYLRKALSQQNRKPEQDKLALVHKDGQFVYKAYSAAMRKLLTEDMKTPVPVYQAVLDGDFTRYKGYEKLLRRKKREYDIQNTPFSDMELNPEIADWLENLSIWDSLNEETIKLNEIQRQDLNKVLQKRYALLQWEQGSGKTLAAIATGLYRMQKQHIHSTWVVSSAISIRNNWDEVLQVYGLSYVFVEKLQDLQKVKPGDFVIMTLNKVSQYQKQIAKKMRLLNQKVQFVLDESDEISNADSVRCKAVLSSFRRCYAKLLTTGTSTRNNISEFAPQLELLYNNSINMISWNAYVYKRSEEDQEELESRVNPYYGQPIPAYKKGYALFSGSHLPERVTVFGIGQKTQDIYNADILDDILAKTVITRTFEEVTGKDIKRIQQVPLQFTPEERDVYNIAIESFYTMRDKYFKTTGNSHKDSAMKLIQQIMMLLRISAAPDTVAEYTGDTPVKIMTALEMVASWPDEIVAIGVRHKVVLDSYVKAFETYMPDRPLFVVTGSTTTFAKRRALRDKLKQSKNGILLCTQQSLPSSVNFEFVNKVLIPELHYNNSGMSQFYMRFVRYTSTELKYIYFLTYVGSIESNQMQMVLCKEKLNRFMRGQDSDLDSIYEKFGVSFDLLSTLMRREADKEGKFHIRWGEQKIA